jgi:hypothetical protein
MPPLIGMALRWALLPFLAILAAAMAHEFWQASRINGLGFASLRHPLALMAMAGILVRVFFRYILRRFDKDDPFDFLDTLEHELTHALVGYLTFSPPISLSASLKAGGEVQLRGSNPLAALAPYFLPLWCSLLMLLGLIVRPGMQAGWSNLIFFMLGWYAYRLAKEYRWRQTDLHIYGFLFSTLTVFTLLLVVLGVLLKARGILSWHWIWESLWATWQSIPQVWSWFQHRLAR